MKKIRIIAVLFLTILLFGCEFMGTPSEKKDPVDDGTPRLEIIGPEEVEVEGECQLELKRYNIDESLKATWTSENYEIASVYKGLVTTKQPGIATIKVVVGDYSAEFKLYVVRPVAETLQIEKNLKLEAGATYELEYQVTPYFASKDILIENNSNVIEVNKDNTITAKIVGTCEITVTSISNNKLQEKVNIQVLPNQAPKFTKKAGYQDILDIPYDQFELPLDDLDIIDNADGDLKSQVTYDTSDFGKYGRHDIVLSVTDKAGNTATFTRKINVIWPYHTKFIGHAGCYHGVANSEEAFLYAAKDYHYQAIECDLHMTKDGVFVLAHDDKFGGYTISTHNYADFANVYETSGNYKSKICTLDTYLDICKEYGCEAIIELKWVTEISVTQSKMPDLINQIKAKGMWENTVFLTSTQAIFRWLRNNGYNDVRCQYLVSSADSQDVLDFCIQYNCDLSTNVTYGGSNSDSWLQKYWDAGLIISTWTFSGENRQVQQWIDKGVEYVTCDCHVIDNFTLYEEFDHTNE